MRWQWLILAVLVGCGADDDSGGEPDAGASPDSAVSDVATPCDTGSQCASGVCIPDEEGMAAGSCAGDCTSSASGVCAADDGCLAGWFRWQLNDNTPRYCRCTPASELDDCGNGDDDCDGLIDEDPTSACSGP